MSAASTDHSIKHFKNESSGYLDEILKASLNLDEDTFWLLLKIGAIYVNEERVEKKKMIAAHSSLRVHTKPKRYDCHYAWNELIVFENDFFLVLNKPAGLPSHPVIDNSLENALTQTSLIRKYPLYVTHRLDTLTSGLIVYGKKTSFVQDFNKQLMKRGLKKTYVALVEGSLELPQRLVHYMDPSPKDPKKLSSTAQMGWDRCELEILDQKFITPQTTWLKINLLTGRTHQIRAQLSHCQAPILGDTLYGSQRVYHKNSIALRSCEIEFEFEDKVLKFALDDQFKEGIDF